MMFLLNNRVLELGDECDPFRDKAFPLTREQYESIALNRLAEMLAAEFARDAEVLNAHPMRIKRLLWMMHDKAKINALRLVWEGGTKARWGQVPELALAGLLTMATHGPVSMEAVDAAVWSKLQH